MSEATIYTDDQKLAEIEREIVMRKRVYPRWVADGRMTQADADHRLAVLKAIAKDYAPEQTPDLFKQAVLDAFDQIDDEDSHAKRRAEAEHRAEVERRARQRW